MVDEIANKIEQEIQEPPFDASDPKAVNTARKKAGRSKKAELEFIKAIMDLPQGRKWMYDLMVFCKNGGGMPYVSGKPDDTAFYCGMLNVYNKLLADVVRAAPDEYIVMCKEN